MWQMLKVFKMKSNGNFFPRLHEMFLSSKHDLLIFNSNNNNLSLNRCTLDNSSLTKDCKNKTHIEIKHPKVKINLLCHFIIILS